tara:strand:+ start:528 stop:1043 length:516 start_codon:yes stop_codon:yes gene_type:complete
MKIFNNNNNEEKIMRTKLPENKFKHIVFGKSKRGGKQAMVSSKLQELGYTFYKDYRYYKGRQWWVLQAKTCGEFIHRTTCLEMLEWYIDKNIINIQDKLNIPKNSSYKVCKHVYGYIITELTPWTKSGHKQIDKVFNNVKEVEDVLNELIAIENKYKAVLKKAIDKTKESA